ncbi:MFS transporter [Actinomadura sp. WMMA1423]|uniref:MFS transporter n=1 Tax=Actinomadura sp. WMMA1423 TaxID=2591108 RepID=UPI00197AE8FC|nr:MFS transporter [Actinomadura sp. WMMA1423]
MPPSLLSLMLVVFGLTTGEFVIAGILPDVAGDLSVSVPAAGRLVSAYALGMIIGGPVVTALTARVPRKPLMTGLIAVSILGNLGSAAAPDYPVLLAARFLAGLVVATFFAVAVATAVSTAPAGREASTIAKVALGLNLGIVLGTPLGTLVGQRLGWQATFASVAALSAAALPMVLRFVPALPAAATGPLRDELRVFAGRDVRLAITLTALGNVGAVTVFTYIAPLLTKVGGFSEGAVPVLLLVYGAGAVAGNLLGGRLSDRDLMTSLIRLLGALAAVLALFWAAGGVRPLAAVLTFALGLLAFAVVPGMQARVLTTAGAAPTLAVAVNASGYQLAAAFAGSLGGALISDGPGLRSLFPAAALLTLAGLATAVHIHRGDRRRTGASARPV